MNWIFASPFGVAIVLLVVHSLFDGEAAGFRDQLVVSDRSRLRYPQGLFRLVPPVVGLPVETASLASASRRGRAMAS